jgi:tripartite-type tricarboxylate transporter receptor subunit TctC
MRKVKIVVGVPPGGAADTLARLLAEEISHAQAVSIVVENRPGAVNIIATDAVSRATPDGNTLLLTTPAFVLNSHLRKLNYDPFTSFESICYLARTPTVIFVNSASTYRTLADLMNAARAKPGELTLAATGPATPAQIAFEMLKRAANVNMTFVPYPGGATVVTAVLGEHVTSALSDYPGAAEQLKAGKLRALAVAAETRIEALPDVPTVAEAGYKDSESDLWFGLAAPAKTPKQAISELAGWFTAAIQVPDVKAKFAIQGLYPVGMCGMDFARYLRKQYDDFGRILREANIKAD